jgi:hypothetical protein
MIGRGVVDAEVSHPPHVDTAGGVRAFDLVVSPDGTVTFLELNPM